MKLVFIILMLFQMCLYSQELQQQAHKIQFSSKGNKIELTVMNPSELTLKDVEVKINCSPEWLKFTSNKVDIAEINSREEKEALFEFLIDKNSPVGKESAIEFQITNNKGEIWIKQIKVIVSAPEYFELYQNYPNPFNPNTTISYQLSRSSKVSLYVYNMLGEKVASIVDGIQEAGYYSPNWNAAGYSSGMYVYQLVANSIDGQRFILRKKMSLIK
ncbi:MAG: T9SS type A sorting domain-containing protein [Clostridiales bacterium]